MDNEQNIEYDKNSNQLSKEIIKINISEEENKSVNNSHIKNNNYEYSSLSFISDHNSNNDLNNKIIKEKENKNKNSYKKVRSNVEGDKKILKFTDDLYSNEEHFKSQKLFKRKNSIQNDCNLDIIDCEKINKNFDKQSSITKIDNPKIYRKSLFNKFHKELQEKQKERINLEINSKKNGDGRESKIKDKNSKFSAFFKLKEKTKKPQKFSYIDNIINKNNSRINSSFRKNFSKEGTEKSIKSIQIFKKNTLFSPFTKNLNITDKLNLNEKKEKIIQVKIRDNKNKIEEKNSPISKKEINKKQTVINKIEWKSFHFFCCLNCNMD